MNTATIEYKQKVWQFLDKMKPGERKKVSMICEAENTDKFIASVKEWMDGKLFQGYISFNKDYTEFYKTEEITFKNQQFKN
ncbi:hypothetical protein [Mangrovibacterium sp.]|uniref:hypothetical protein n=1 Tax=Mangrovibacterium sp. TaxID=1961364 RepID=UPI003563DFF4